MDDQECVSDQCLDFLKRIIESKKDKEGQCSSHHALKPRRERKKGSMTKLSKRPKMGSVRNLRKYLTLSDNKVQRLMTNQTSNVANTPLTGLGVLTRAGRRRLAIDSRDDLPGTLDDAANAPFSKRKKKDGNVLEISHSSKGKVPLASTSARKSPKDGVQTDPIISKVTLLPIDNDADDNHKNNEHNESGLEALKGVRGTSHALDPISDNSECDFARDSALLLDDQFCSFSVDNIKQQNEKHQKTIHFLQSLLTIHSHHLGQCSVDEEEKKLIKV